jgi:hypothetical protein
MRNPCYILIALVCIATQHIAAQQGPPERDQGRQPTEHTGSRARRVAPNTPRERQGPAQQWLRQLEQSDPEMHAKVQQMRQENPEAFGQWMRQRLMERRRNALLERHPAFAAFLKSLPESERQALEADLFPSHRRDNRQQDTPMNRTDRAKPDRPPAAEDGGDPRLRHFEQEIERAEQRIEHLRELLEKRRALLEIMPED